MSDYNLFLEPDEDIETFRDIITDNVFIKGELLKKGEKKSFGNTSSSIVKYLSSIILICNKLLRLFIDIDFQKDMIIF